LFDFLVLVKTCYDLSPIKCWGHADIITACKNKIQQYLWNYEMFKIRIGIIGVFIISQTIVKLI